MRFNNLKNYEPFGPLRQAFEGDPGAGWGIHNRHQVVAGDLAAAANSSTGKGIGKAALCPAAQPFHELDQLFIQDAIRCNELV